MYGPGPSSNVKAITLLPVVGVGAGAAGAGFGSGFGSGGLGKFPSFWAVGFCRYLATVAVGTLMVNSP